MNRGASGSWGVLALAAIIALPVLAYWCGGSKALGQLFGWLFS